MTKLEVGDLILTNTYTDNTRVEVCQYRGQTGQLMYTLYDPECRMLSMLERYIKDTESLPYSSTILKKNDRRYIPIMNAISDSLKSKKAFNHNEVK
ncbi:hypothetical protein AVV36_gp110 [Pectobacterium bacteriophage PM2]|uniref:Uncharacterized protein n=1 Tax=Pectobacterium bacteriophage PM2 TaxID=1429794 RepID=A0A0A0Q3F3_9CAUD|nr:hypothetical protein AVV36_gp110 [Pectobacterium bacteriophage PM2]AHY25072.1 hypothetical protein PM2_110 [Pectobacterium bacteriophage PM2]